METKVKCPMCDGTGEKTVISHQWPYKVHAVPPSDLRVGKSGQNLRINTDGNPVWRDVPIESEV